MTFCIIFYKFFFLFAEAIKYFFQTICAALISFCLQAIIEFPQFLLFFIKRLPTCQETLVFILRCRSRNNCIGYRILLAGNINLAVLYKKSQAIFFMTIIKYSQKKKRRRIGFSGK